jgi:hypothetical protein
MLECKTISVSINRDWQELYESIWQPRDFPKWASGLSKSELTEEADGWWQAEGPEGCVRIKFTEHNQFGVMDHVIDVGGGKMVSAPMRVLPNGNGAEVMFTLFRQPEMDDAKYQADADWIARDLDSLKKLAENSI